MMTSLRLRLWLPLSVLLAGAALLAADVKAPPQADKRVAGALEQAKLRSTVDDAGNYKVVFNYRDTGEQHPVYIASATRKIGSLELRRIWTPGYRTYDEAEAKWLEDLLARNQGAFPGGWCVEEHNGKHVPVFAILFPADGDPALLSQVLADVARVGYQYHGVPSVSLNHLQLHVELPPGTWKTALNGNQGTVGIKWDGHQVVVSENAIEVGGKPHRLANIRKVRLFAGPDGKLAITADRRIIPLAKAIDVPTARAD
jgi:hypothetical protein